MDQSLEVRESRGAVAKRESAQNEQMEEIR